MFFHAVMLELRVLIALGVLMMHHAVYVILFAPFRYGMDCCHYSFGSHVENVVVAGYCDWSLLFVSIHHLR